MNKLIGLIIMLSAAIALMARLTLIWPSGVLLPLRRSSGVGSAPPLKTSRPTLAGFSFTRGRKLKLPPHVLRSEPPPFSMLDFFPFGVILKANYTVGGNSMKKKWMLALVAVAVLALYVGAFHDAFAAERTMVLRVPQCV
jgi:hypothetical protein